MIYQLFEVVGLAQGIAVLGAIIYFAIPHKEQRKKYNIYVPQDTDVATAPRRF